MSLILPRHYNWVVNRTRICNSRTVFRNGQVRTTRSCTPYRSTSPPPMSAADGVNIPFPRAFVRRDEYINAESVSVTIQMEVPDAEQDIVDGSDALDFLGDVSSYDCLIHIHRPDLSTFSGAIPRSDEDIPGFMLFWMRAATVVGVIVSVCTPSRIATDDYLTQALPSGVSVRYLFRA